MKVDCFVVSTASQAEFLLPCVYARKKGRSSNQGNVHVKKEIINIYSGHTGFNS